MFAAAFALALATSPPAAPKPVIVDPTSEQVAAETHQQAQVNRKAREQFTRQCQQGLTDYCYPLGRLLKLGLGGPADPEGAKTLFERACRGHVTTTVVAAMPGYRPHLAVGDTASSCPPIAVAHATRAPQHLPAGAGWWRALGAKS